MCEVVSGEKRSFADVLPPPPASILLVWPDYPSPLPPLGLLKLAAYHRARGDTVALIRPPRTPGWVPDVVLVASLFTYAWRAAAEAVRLYRTFFPRAMVVLGGIYASLMPERAASAVRLRHRVGGACARGGGAATGLRPGAGLAV